MTSKCSFYCYRSTKSKRKNSSSKPEKIQLIFFDMDGVLTNTLSSWRYIHKHFGTSNERSVDDYLRGKIDDLEFIKRDLSMWKINGKFTTKQYLSTILQEIPFQSGAEQCISYLREHRVKTCIISAGLDLLTNMVAEHLDMDYAYANGVHTDTMGRLTGEGILRVPLKHKEKAVHDLLSKVHIPVSRCAAVGNSCFDVSMFEATALSIAFNPADDCVRKAADIVVEGSDLRQLIPVLHPFI